MFLAYIHLCSTLIFTDSFCLLVHAVCYLYVAVASLIIPSFPFMYHFRINFLVHLMTLLVVLMIVDRFRQCLFLFELLSVKLF